MGALTVYTAPAAEPITRAEAKIFLRVDTGITSEDSLIDMLISVARGIAEDQTRLALISQTLEWRLDQFPPGTDSRLGDFADRIDLPRAPVQSITHVKYTDSAGATQTMSASDYSLDLYNYPARLVPAYGTSWPSAREFPGSVVVRFVAGFGASGSSVPAPLRQAILLLVGHFYENRELIVRGQVAELPYAVEQILSNATRFALCAGG